MTLTLFGRLIRRVRALLRGDALDRELDDEAWQHIEMESEDLARRRGIPLDKARREARVAFGGMTRMREEHADARGVRWVADAVQDLRYAARSLRRNPGFSVSAILVLALAIGATSAVYSAVNAVLGNPVHDRLVLMHFRGFASLSTVDYRAIEEQQRSFEFVGGRRGGDMAYNDGGEAEELRVHAVTAGWFGALDVRAARGRLITASDEVVGAPLVAVVSDALASRRLGGAEAALGRTITLDGNAHLVVGVLPTGLRDLVGANPEVFTPLQLATPARRGPFGMLVIARLNPDVSFEAATQDVRRIGEAIFPLWAAAGYTDNKSYFEARPYRGSALGSARRMLGLFAAAAALVLLIGVANVSSLMLVRAIGRAREVSLRAALGASWARLARLFAAESLLLGVAGSVTGIGVGALILRLFLVAGPRMTGLAAARMDLGAVAFALGVALFSAAAVGAYPVVSLLRGRGRALAGSQSVGGGRDSRSLRGAFVVAQFALALPALAVAALLGASVLKLGRLDAGFDPERLLTVRVSLPAGQYGDPQRVAAYWSRAITGVEGIPGVAAVGLGTSMPPNDFGDSNDNFDLVDRPTGAGNAESSVAWPAATASYFGALGVRLLEGRLFTPGDTAGAPPVIVVSRSWAGRYYPDGSALGRTMQRGGCTDCPLTTIVGVVDDIRYSGLGGDPESFHTPVAQAWSRTIYLFARTTVDPAQLVGPVRTALRAVDPAIPISDLAPMTQRLAESESQRRQLAILLTTFASAALALAAVGIFGMLSYQVSARRREIGVRMALGASRRAVVRMVVGAGLRHATLGCALGLGASLAAGRLVSSMLFEVTSYDPATLGAVTSLLVLVACLASWLPARRAAAIDPMTALRSD